MRGQGEGCCVPGGSAGHGRKVRPLSPGEGGPGGPEPWGLKVIESQYSKMLDLHPIYPIFLIILMIILMIFFSWKSHGLQRKDFQKSFYVLLVMVKFQLCKEENDIFPNVWPILFQKSDLVLKGFGYLKTPMCRCVVYKAHKSHKRYWNTCFLPPNFDSRRRRIFWSSMLRRRQLPRNARRGVDIDRESQMTGISGFNMV